MLLLSNGIAPAEAQRAAQTQRAKIVMPLGLVEPVWPSDNPYTTAKMELGRALFFDKRLSADETVACASCHDPKFAFTDGQPFSTGVRNQKGGRSAPTVINRVYSVEQFWDGRAVTLEEQAKGPIQNPIEMATTHDAVVTKLRGVKGYAPLFRAAFGSEDVDIDRVAKAIATFERRVVSGNSAYDRYKAGNKTALSESARRGFMVFFDKAKCDQCHFGINFTDGSFNNLGVGMDKPEPDLGRELYTKRASERGAFKTPTLREIARTAPYMHDGSLTTLEDVVEYYNKGGNPNPNLDQRMKKLDLTEQDKKDLVEFLKSLNGEGWQHAQAPKSLPQ
ncbi:MAG: c-type cytochrome [Acidobacteria bacterium]|nr:c-type cytochrome [Acidobacteriota bacterium]